MRLIAGPLVAALFLTGCGLCDYTIDAQSISKTPLAQADTGYKNSGFSKEVYERMERERTEAEAKMTPEQRAAREDMKRKMREQSEATAKARADKIAAGYDPAKDPMVKFRKPTAQECGVYYGGLGIVWVGGLGLLLGIAHMLSKRLTGRGLLAWLTGRGLR
jgi:uncharacterized membrane protein